MSLVEHIISLYAPHLCVGCGTEADALLCPACIAALGGVPDRCYKCKAVSRGSETCMNCQSVTPLRRVTVAAYYDDESVQRILHLTKYGRARAGVQSMADCLMPKLRGLPAGAIFVPVPTASRRIRQRGYDQAVLLARELSVRTGRPSERYLARLGQAHQVGSGRAERLRQLEGAFRPLREQQIRGRHLILVDDVLTTGATLETAARILKHAGAAQVDAVVFAQAS